MTGAELKAQARAQLGGGIFKNEWLTALDITSANFFSNQGIISKIRMSLAERTSAAVLFI